MSNTINPTLDTKITCSVTLGDLANIIHRARNSIDDKTTIAVTHTGELMRYDPEDDEPALAAKIFDAYAEGYTDETAEEMAERVFELGWVTMAVRAVAAEVAGLVEVPRDIISQRDADTDYVFVAYDLCDNMRAWVGVDRDPEYLVDTALVHVFAEPGEEVTWEELADELDDVRDNIATMVELVILDAI